MSKKHPRSKAKASQKPNATTVKPRLSRQKGDLREKAAVLVISSVLMLAFLWLVGHFFPDAKGHIGPDYSYFGPGLLDGYYWFHTNGLLHVPWFTPSFCGGSLNFPNLQRSFYSFPQFLAFIVDPFVAITTTVYLFAFLGGGGFYLLLRRGFRTSRWSALLGGGLFLFNGFYSHRMIIGHFGYHNYMLLPLVIFLLLRSHPVENGTRWASIVFDASVAGVIIALMAMSDFVTLLIPALLSVVFVGIIHGLIFGRKRWFWVRLGLGGLIALLLSLAKLTAVVAFMRTVPRNSYLLPGVDSLFHSFVLVLRCLFVGIEIDPNRGDWIRNIEWPIGQHEWDYSVSFAPALFLLYGLARMIGAFMKQGVAATLRSRKKSDWLWIGAGVFILLLPMVLNVYTPWWNAFLKTIPVIQSSSILFRWFLLYIPVVILGSALILERLVPAKLRVAACVAALSCCLVTKASIRNYHYTEDTYDPQPIVHGFHQVETGAHTPAISTMGFYQDDKGQPELPVNRNDTFMQGVSQILAYESLFGYRLEYLPFKTLHPGKALATSNGVLNVKNPASYLWPDENHCKPGDHFKIEDKAAAEAFLNYKPFPFRMSLIQRIANWTTLISFATVILFQTVFLIGILSRHRGSNSPAEAPRPAESPFGDGRETEASAG